MLEMLSRKSTSCLTFATTALMSKSFVKFTNMWKNESFFTFWKMLHYRETRVFVYDDKRGNIFAG